MSASATSTTPCSASGLSASANCRLRQRPSKRKQDQYERFCHEYHAMLSQRSIRERELQAKAKALEEKSRQIDRERALEGGTTFWRPHLVALLVAWAAISA